MAFRDDREAGVQRIETLERDLTSTKNELEAATLRAAEVDDLRKRVVDLTRERDTLKAGVEPMWSAKVRTLRVGMVALIAAVGVVGVIMYVVEGRAQRRAALLDEQRASQLAQCEASVDPIRAERDTARSELDQIDTVHAEELGRLQSALGTAQSREAGRALLVVAHVTSRSGAVPDGADDECVLAIRDITTGDCAATVICGHTRVYPFNEPSPAVQCTSAGELPWHIGEDEAHPLAHGSAVVRRDWPPLFEYDASARSLVVRETGAPAFELRMRVEPARTYELR